MGNCLETKLKGAVNNDSLPLLNGIEYKNIISATNSVLTINQINQSTKAKVVVRGDYHITVNDVSYQDETVELTGTVYIKIYGQPTDNGSVTVLVNNDMKTNGFGLDPNDAKLKCMQTIETLYSYSVFTLPGMVNSKSVLSGSPKFSTWLNLAYANRSNTALINGITRINQYEPDTGFVMDLANCNLSYFGPLVKLKTLDYVPTGTDLDAIAQAQVAAPYSRTSGSISVGIKDPHSATVRKTITFDSSLPDGYSIS